MSLRPGLTSILCTTALALAAPAAALADDSTAPALGETSRDLIVGTPAGAERPDGEAIAPRVTVVDRADRAQTADARYVEPNRTFRASGLPAVLNDPLFARQWALATTDGVNAPGAWFRSQGAGTVIAIVDSGVDMGHRDLAGSLWTNPGEVPGNGIDDDHDGYVDDVHGPDIVAGDGDPSDVYGHGTAMAGAAAAAGGNGVGVSGVAPQARIMPVRVLGDDGAGNTATMIAGVQWAVAHGADVINLSMNGPDPSQALNETLAAAKTAGVTVVASAGNDGGDRDQAPSYPASTPGHGAISVAAADQSSQLTNFSGHGASVDLAAPGANVLSTARGGGFAQTSGTSVAAAQVSGAAAVLAAAAPSATPDQIRAALVSGARHDVAAGSVGGGNLDLTSALTRLVPGAAAATKVSIASKRSIRSRSARVALRWRAVGAVGTVARWDVRVGKRSMPVRASSARGVARAASASGRQIVKLRPGRYRYRVTAYDASGRAVATRAGKVKVAAKKRGTHAKRSHRR